MKEAEVVFSTPETMSFKQPKVISLALSPSMTAEELKILVAEKKDPVARAKIRVSALMEGPSGSLVLNARSWNVKCSADGSYAMNLPDVPVYEVKVYAADKEPWFERWNGLAQSDEVRDFTLP